MTARHEFSKIIDELDVTLRHMADRGCDGFDCAKAGLAKMAAWGQPAVQDNETLDGIRTNLGDCKRCKLADRRKNIVFGAGDAEARLVFVGEGPGYDEDQQGEPFVGAAGQLLTKIIQAIKLDRNRVYICNVIKCRPPGNRNPEADEIETCFPFLQRQLASIRPDFIVALGAFAAQTLLQTTTPISILRGRFHDYRGIKVLPTYHPAYLLRNEDKKRDVWEDMKMLMKEYFHED
jgi:DNA polymerase